MSANGHGQQSRQSTPAIDRALAPRKPTGGSFTEMTLRDFFAAKALIGLVANGNWPVEQFADTAYRIADAMLDERDKRAEPTP